MKRTTNHESRKTGFTLIEMLVAMAVFAVLVVIVGSSFVYVLDLQRYAFNVQKVQENSSFFLEAFAKELRTSTIASIPDSNCASGTDPSLTIINQDGEAVQYALSGYNLVRTVNGAPSTVNSNSIRFTNLGFCVLGALTGDLRQPRITMVAGITTPDARQKALAYIQTTLSLRNISD